MKKISFKNGKGLTLRGYIFTPKKYDTAVVFLHGFPSDCRGGTGKRIGPSLMKKGYLVLTFDFSGTKTSEGKFEDKLMSKEVKDVHYAIDFLFRNYCFKKLVLIGHSTGAIDASLYAYKDKRIDKLILLGAVSDLKHSARYDFNDEQVRDFWTKGYIIYKRGKKWVKNKKLKKAFYDEFFTLDIPKAMKKYRRPLLIIHGEKDEAIPVNDPQALYALARRPKKLVIVRDADHSFRNPRHWKKVVDAMMRFMK
ncbi:alpha/beta hydrolase [Candidatus Woesearchaeota archaeon]|nr:alpha/beta hydrolase [Candidatus Woesearchaeota archaeon]